MGWKDWVYGDLVSAADFQSLVQDQTVQRYASSSARSAALGSAVAEGMVSYLDDTNSVEVYSGSGWDAIGGTGRNAIINGAFDFWQRGTAAVTTSTFSADRWNFYGQGTGTGHSATRQTFTPGAAPVAGYESEFYYQDVITSGSDANTQLLMLQKIEDVRKFAGETVTLSFWAKATSGTPKIGAELYQDFGSGGSSAVSGTGQSATISTSWARYSFTFAVPSISGKTIGTGSSLYTNIWFSAGSTWNTRSGSVGLQSATFHIWGVQLEAGSSATPFKRNAPSIQGELAACQRYYWRTGSESIYERFFSGFATGTTVAQFQVQFPVTMRAIPSSADSSAANLFQIDDGVTQTTCSSVNTLTDQFTTRGGRILMNTASGLTQYRPYALRANNSTSAYLGWSAEL